MVLRDRAPGRKPEPEPGARPGHQPGPCLGGNGLTEPRKGWQGADKRPGGSVRLVWTCRARTTHGPGRVGGGSQASSARDSDRRRRGAAARPGRGLACPCVTVSHGGGRVPHLSPTTNVHLSSRGQRPKSQSPEAPGERPSVLAPSSLCEGSGSLGWGLPPSGPCLCLDILVSSCKDAWLWV